jgi:hypothetical protein
MLNVVIKGLEKIGEWSEEKAKLYKSSASFAVNKGVYTAAMDMRKKLKSGSLGLTPLADFPKRAGGRKGNPLTPLAPGIRYTYDKKTMTGMVGFITAGSRNRKLVAWAEKSADGYVMNLTEGRIQELHSKGVHLKKETQARGIIVPRRNPVSQYLGMYGDTIFDKVKEVFSIKINGGRV